MNDLTKYTADLDDVYAQSIAAGQEALFEAAVSGDVSKVPEAVVKEALSGKILSKAAGVGAGALCAAYGAAPLAPLCAAAGSWVAGQIAGVASSIGSAVWKAVTGQEGKGIDYIPYNANLAGLEQKREAILSALSLSGDDPVTVAAIKKIADDLAPLYDKKDPSLLLPTRQRARDMVRMPGSAGYSTFYIVPPWQIAPQDFQPVTSGLAWEKGGRPVAFVDMRAEGWQTRVIDALLYGYVAGGMPVIWLRDKMLAKYASDPSATYGAILAEASTAMVPELDKLAKARIAYVLEESAIRRNLRATQAVKNVERALRKTHPSWPQREIDKARDLIVSSVKSQDPDTIASAVKAIETPKPKSDDTGTKRKNGSKGGAGLAIGAVIGILVLVMAKRLP